MSNESKFKPPLRSTREPLSARDDWERHISRATYHALESIGDACRLMCQEHPDLLDQIAAGIESFLSDGDVFDQVARRLLELDPEYWGYRIGELDEQIAKRIIGQVI